MSKGDDLMLTSALDFLLDSFGKDGIIEFFIESERSEIEIEIETKEVQ